MAKRPWNSAFRPRSGGVQINVSNVPPTMREKFIAKCRREQKSQRNLLLGWINNWVADRRPDEDRAE